jgi:uncharacterized membrane protein YbhN (UPF0104 family)
LSGNQTSERRRVIRLVGFAAVVGFAVYVLLPQVAELGDAVSALREGRWRYLAVALAGAALTYVAGGWAVSASIRLKLSFPRTLMAQLAASLMAFITPAGLGWVAVIDSYLRKAGADDHTAHTATTLTMIITFLSHIGLLAAAIPLLPTLRLPSIQLPSAHVVAEVVVAVLVLAGVAFWIPASRRRILKELVDMAQAIPAVLGDPKRSIVMVLAAVAVNLAFAVALIGSIAAYSPVPSLLGVLVAYMVSATIATISPTPGGIGAMEAALVASLTRLGVAGGAAVAAALTFRVATFWLPMPVGGWALRRGRKESWL